MNDFRLIAILILILLTISLFTVVSPYKEDQTELVQNGDFQQGSAGWTSAHGWNPTFRSGIAILENHDASRRVFLQQRLPVPQEATNLKLTGEVFTRDISQGKTAWYGAHLFLLALDEKNRGLWDFYPHDLKVSQTSKEWLSYSKWFPIHPKAVELIVGMGINNATGIMRVRNISLSPAKEQIWFRVATYTLLALWGGTLLWIGITLRNFFLGNIVRGSFTTIICLIVLGSLMPGPTKDLILNRGQVGFLDLVAYLSEKLPWPILQAEFKVQSLQKVGHFALFATLAMVVRLGQSCNRLTAQLVPLMLFAATTEVLQFFAFERDPAVMDWLIDVGGLAFGFFISTLVRVKHKLLAFKNLGGRFINR